MGGMVEAIEQGFPQKEIAEASYRFQQSVEMRDKVIVGVNDFVQEDETPIPILYIDESTAERQLSRLGSQEDPRQRESAAFPRGAERDRPRREYDARCSTASAPTPRSAKCATRCERCGESMKKFP